MSDAQKSKLSAAMMGVHGKKVVCGDRTFNSAREAAQYYNVVPSTFRNWINGRCKMPEKYKKIGLKYLDE